MTLLYVISPTVDSDITSNEITINGIPYAHAIPLLYTIEDLQTLSKYTLKGEIMDIKSNEITIKIHDYQDQNTSNIIKFKATNYTIMKPTTIQDSEKFRIGEDIYLFLLNKELDFSNNYSGFVASKYVIAEGIAYDIILGKQASPLKQLKSGIHSQYVKCNDGLELLIKENNGKPACVKPETKQKLIERGWVKPV